MTLEELKKLCNEAERSGFGSDLPMSRNSYFIFAARVALPKLIAVAEAANDLATEWRCHSTHFNEAVRQDALFRTLDALEAP